MQILYNYVGMCRIYEQRSQLDTRKRIASSMRLRICISIRRSTSAELRLITILFERDISLRAMRRCRRQLITGARRSFYINGISARRFSAKRD